jgi:dTDP-glucose 4,6-dehydratase
MKLLVTGGLGFIGSNFILKLLEKFPDYQITNLDDESYGSNHQNLLEIKNIKKYKFVKGNITNNLIVEKLVSKADIVINFAAESHVDRSILNAKPFMDSNILGIFTILENIKKYKKKLVHISTDEVFGSLELESANEDFKLNPSSPYAASKGAAELLINSYFKTYDCETIITRCTNNYGPKQFPEKLIPKTIIRANLDKSIPVYGTGKNIRDWIFVDDHCSAIEKVIHEGVSGESYNISASNEIDNIEIIEKILSFLGKSSNLINFVDDRPGHDFRYSLDSSKICSLGWKPKTSFDEGIKKTIEWYQKNKSWWNNIDKNILAETPWK